MKMAIGILLLASGAIHADTLFLQGSPNLNSTDFVDDRVADDFTLGSASTLSQIDFWYTAFDQSDLSSVTYAIYNDAGGALGSQLYTGTVTPTTSFDSIDDTFYATIALPGLSLGAGTFWLELHGGVSLTDDNGTITVWWDNADDNVTYDALLSPTATPLNPPSVPVTFSGSEQQAFEVDGTAQSTVPEPSSVAITGAALLLVIRAARRAARPDKTRECVSQAARDWPPTRRRITVTTAVSTGASA
jgi:hypothetical protein